MKVRIYNSDVELISKLFVAENASVSIHDPVWRIKQITGAKKYDQMESPDVLVNTSSYLVKEDIHFEYFDYVIDFSSTKPDMFLSAGYEMEELNFINNPDRTMRWIFPGSLETPTFLNFYNSANRKARWYSKIIRKAFKLGVSRIFNSGKFRIYYRKPLRIDALTSGVAFDNYSIFTGTVGPNRKMIMELNSDHSTTHFVKIPLNNESRELLNNELRSLETLKQKELKSFVYPDSLTNSDPSGILSNIKPSNALQLDALSGKHLQMFEELYSKTAKWVSLSSAVFYKSARQNISKLSIASRFDESWSIYRSLKAISDNIVHDGKFIPLAMSHSDFTPWNTYASEDKIYVYDWEFSKSNTPMLFDLFHFVFQSGVLLKRQDYAEIKSEIDIALSHPICRKMIERYE
ncbi:MAG: hypothetical protein HKN92_08725, partial [Chitinophagales bacterium]|nr:hypothetical protein [Chitinophagales bacterium]